MGNVKILKFEGDLDKLGAEKCFYKQSCVKYFAKNNKIR